MTFTLEALPAHKGDALLLQFGSSANPRLALIDGGPADVYEPQIKPRLNAIRQARGLAPGQPLPLDWVALSHIDDDHINGILSLMGELVDAQTADQPPPYRLSNIWHNSFDDILGTTPAQLQAALTTRFGAASTGDSVMEMAPNLPRDLAMILASVAQGRQLRDDIKALGLTLNAPFKELVMLQPGKEPTISFGGTGAGSIKVRVVGPQKAQLVALQKEHDAYLKQLKKKKVPAEAALAEFTDTSAPNLSSIVVEVRSGSKVMLLTGDARGDFILDGLKQCKLLTAGNPYVIDVLKVPHHGSDRNMAQEFFEQVHATHYVFSGDGQHGNPERETLRMLFEARRAVPALKAQPFTIWLTYPREDIDVGRKADWEKEFKKGNRSRHWDAKKDGLVQFFAESKQYKLTYDLKDKDPVVIAL